MIEMRNPARRTAPAFRWNNDKQEFELMGTITCECTGEWSNKVKSWTEIDKPCGNQYSLGRTGRKGHYYFILEATA